MTARRRYLTPRQKAEVIKQQGGMCTLCGEHLGGDEDPTEFDHSRPLALLGTNDLLNIEAVHRACHRWKTDGDVARIAKAKRQAGETGQRARKSKRKIRSAGFGGWRRLNGEIVKR